MRASDLLFSIGRPIAYYPSLTKPLGSVNACLFFCQIFYWQDKATSDLGVYKTAEEIEIETGMTYKEQATARKMLVEKGILIETHKRIEHKIFYRIDLDKLDFAISSFVNSRNADREVRELTKREFDLYTETTTETTTEIKDLNTYGDNDASHHSTNTNIENENPSSLSKQKKQEKFTEDDLQCAEWLINLRSQAFTSKGMAKPKDPQVRKWANDVRMMREIDGRTHREICELFKWVCETGRELEFCQSANKLRSKWDELQLKRFNAKNNVTGYRKPLNPLQAAQEAIKAAGITYDDDEIL